MAKRYIQRVGNKQSISKELFKKIIEKIENPKEKIFVDLFGGGGSMSGESINYFKSFIYNELDKGIFELFIAVQNDDLIKNLKGKWITREEFFRIRNEGYKNDEENLILTAWSFGNSRSTYVFGKNIERKKELTHKIINSKTEKEYKEYIKQYNEEKVAHFEKYGAVWDCFLYDNDRKEFTQSKNKRFYKFGARGKRIRKFYKNFDFDLIKKERGKSDHKSDKQLLSDLESLQRLESLQSLQSLQSLESLERLERLQSLQSLERLESLQRLERLEILESLQRLEILESLQRLERLQNLQSLESLQNLQSLEILERLQSLQSLESLESLERLQSLQSLERLEVYNLDYRKVQLPKKDDCIIYLDPPYKGTKKYETDFNYEEFYEFVRDLKEKGYTIFVSEYDFPFGDIIWKKIKRGFLSQKKDNFSGIEKLYFIKK